MFALAVVSGLPLRPKSVYMCVHFCTSTRFGMHNTVCPVRGHVCVDVYICACVAVRGCCYALPLLVMMCIWDWLFRRLVFSLSCIWSRLIEGKQIRRGQEPWFSLFPFSGLGTGQMCLWPTWFRFLLLLVLLFFDWSSCPVFMALLILFFFFPRL